MPPPGSQRRVSRVEDRGLLTGRGRFVTDNVPEFTGRALDRWAYKHRARLDFIQPEKPVENAFVESFNGKFRDECLNEHWFVDLGDAREKIKAWRQDYNTSRPHSSLGNLTPEKFRSQFLQTSNNHRELSPGVVP